MPKRREIVEAALAPRGLDYAPGSILGRAAGRSRKQPDNEFEALQAAPPGCEPEASREEVEALREAIIDAYDSLSEKERFVCDAELFERLSLSQVGERIARSKTQSRRIRVKAMEHLRELLKDHPLVKERLRG